MAIPLNDNIATRSNKPTDSRAMDFAGGVSAPFASIAAAISAINVAYRYQFLSIWAKAANGDSLEYWWRVDTTDASLEPRTKESYTFNSDNSVILSAGYNYGDIIIIPTNNISNLQIGTTPGGSEISPSTAILTTDPPYKISSTLGYLKANTTIYFTGLVTGTKILIYKAF